MSADNPICWFCGQPGATTECKDATRTYRPICPTCIVAKAIAPGPFDLNDIRTAKVGRNEPCPCGSGQKWKRCHGAK